MRVSKIEARRVFTRYGWQPISATNFLTSRGSEAWMYDNGRYKMSVYCSAREHSLKYYGKVIDRLANERMYFSGLRTRIATFDVLSTFDMFDNLKLKMKL